MLYNVGMLPKLYRFLFSLIVLTSVATCQALTPEPGKGVTRQETAAPAATAVATAGAEAGAPAGQSVETTVPTGAPDGAALAAADLMVADLLVYGDTLDAGWQDWSWDTTLNLAASPPVHSGTAAMRATFTAGWAGVQLGYHGAALDISAYDTLVFGCTAGRTAGRACALF